MDGLLWQWTDATRKFFGFACATLLLTLTNLEVAIWAGVPPVGAAFAVSTNVTLKLPAMTVAQPRNIVFAYAIASAATALTIHRFDNYMLEMLVAVVATSLTMRLFGVFNSPALALPAIAIAADASLSAIFLATAGCAACTILLAFCYLRIVMKLPDPGFWIRGSMPLSPHRFAQMGEKNMSEI